MMEEVRQIAQRIVEVREATGMADADVAQKLDIELAAYRRLEAGQEDIPIGFLTRFADAFSIPLTSLLSGEEPKLSHFCVTRGGKGAAIERYPGYAYRALAQRFIRKKCEPFLVTLTPGAIPKLNAHTGHEMDFVLHGRIKVIVGEHEMVLEPGDSIYLDAAYMHGFEAMGDEPGEFLALVMK